MSSPQIETLTAATPAEVDEIQQLIATAASHDNVSAVSEAYELALTTGQTDVRHVLARGDRELIGYAVCERGGTAELVVAPSARRRGIGTALWSRVAADRIWAHGNLPAAQQFARSQQLTPGRELHHMSRDLTPADADPPALPAGFSVRTFVVGEDEPDWLDVNAAAFVDHPEQGRVDLDALRARMSQEWFDPDGFLMVIDDATGALAAYHWTKREPGSATGEVYVVGVDPAYQGRGIAKPLTALGLAHLATVGSERVDLYVDGTNERALATYRGLGFATATLHVVYAADSVVSANPVGGPVDVAGPDLDG